MPPLLVSTIWPAASTVRDDVAFDRQPQDHEDRNRPDQPEGGGQAVKPLRIIDIQTRGVGSCISHLFPLGFSATCRLAKYPAMYTT